MQHTRPRPGGRGGTCWMDLEGQVRGHSLTLLCYPAGAKRNAPSGPLASSAPCAVTATTGVTVLPPPVPASVNLATKAHAARSGCAPRACTAQAAACPAPVMPATPSGRSWGRVSRGQGWGGLWWRGGSQGTNPTSSQIIQAGSERAGTSAITFTGQSDEKK